MRRILLMTANLEHPKINNFFLFFFYIYKKIIFLEIEEGVFHESDFFFYLFIESAR